MRRFIPPLILLLTLACSLVNLPAVQPTAMQATAAPTETSSAATEPRTITSAEFSLTLPAGWKHAFLKFGLTPTPSYNPEFQADELLVISRAEPYTHCIVFRKELAEGEDLESAMQTAYEVLKYYSNAEISLQPIQVNGLDAIEKVYRRPSGEPWYQVRDVWFQRDSTLLVLSCWANPKQYDKVLPEFEAILQSMRFP